MFTKQAPASIDIIIVGGGICGLACAYSLGQSGHKVRILEKSDGKRCAVGIQAPPNLTKILLQWGQQHRMSEWVKGRRSPLHSLESGDLLGYIGWREDVLQATGADLLYTSHNDLYEMLFDLATSVGADILFQAPVVRVNVDEGTNTPEVILEDGRLLRADLIIGADGDESIIRDFVTERSPELRKSPIDGGTCRYGTVIPYEKLLEDAELAKWATSTEWPFWMGNGKCILGHSVGERKGFYFYAIWPDIDDNGQKRWQSAIKTDEIDFSSCPDYIRRAFTLVPEAMYVKALDRSHAEDWIHDSGRVMIVGEAAHPLPPLTFYGPGLAVEDAAVLGELMTYIRTIDQLQQLLYAFQELRQERCHQVLEVVEANIASITLPPGTAQEERDVGLRNSLLESDIDEKWDDAALLEQYQSIADIFGYDAHEAAQEWWLKWGILDNSNKGMHSYGSMDFHFEVTTHNSIATGTGIQ